MATVLGHLTAASLVVVAIDVWPRYSVSVPGQLMVVALVVILNQIVWSYSGPRPQLTPRELLRVVGAYVLLVLAFAAADVALGFFFVGGHSLSEAFYNAHGIAGWALSTLVVLGGVFLGIPSVVRLLLLHYARPRP